MKVTIKIMLAIWTIAVSSMAFADIPVARGSYVDINVGYSKIVDSDFMDNVTGLGLNFNVGYKMMPFFAVEAGYTTYGASKSSFTGANAIDAVIKGILPFQEVGVELFAKLGPVYVNNSKLPDGVSSNTTNVYYALGGDYALSPNMLVVLQWSQATGNSNTGNFQLLSIGASYLF
jgi:hypothetical protein